MYYEFCVKFYEIVSGTKMTFIVYDFLEHRKAGNTGNKIFSFKDETARREGRKIDDFLFSFTGQVLSGVTNLCK